MPSRGMSVPRRILVGVAASLVAACGSVLALEPLQFDEATGERDGAGGQDAPSGDVVTSDRNVVADAADVRTDGTFCSSDAHDCPTSPASAGGRRHSHVAFRAFIEECPLAGEPAAEVKPHQ